MDVVRNFLTRYEQTREEELSIEDYLDACKRDPLVYATAAERMIECLRVFPDPSDVMHEPSPVPRRNIVRRFLTAYHCERITQPKAVGSGEAACHSAGFGCALAASRARCSAAFFST